MRILFIGDIVGRPGRQAVRQLLPMLQNLWAPDLIVANGENMAGGAGITGATAAEIFEAGVHVITSGDHIWDQKEIMAVLETETRILRPLNYPPGAPGQGSLVLRDFDPPVAVINLQGRVFMPELENPFLRIEKELERLAPLQPIILVDFHAEATSEKIAMGRMLDGRVSAVIGTHTHVQTADEQIFPGGTAYLTDAGFTGPHESVIGRQIEPVIRRFRTNLPQRFHVAKEDVRLQGVLIDIDPLTRKARDIRRISESLSKPLQTTDPQQIPLQRPAQPT